MCLGEVAQVVAVVPEDATARVLAGGRERTVSTALQPRVRPGDRVLVHTGFVVEVLAATGDVVARVGEEEP